MSTTTLKPKKPDYRLKIKDRSTHDSCIIGAGWKNSDGSISIQISKLIKIEVNSGLFITLFPIEEKKP